MKSNCDLPSLPELPEGSSEPVFNEPWEASAFAITVSLNQTGLFTWSEWVEYFSREIKEAESAPGYSDQSSGQYYHRWFAALEKMVLAKEMLDKRAIDSKQKHLRDNPPPHNHHARREPIAVA